MFPAFKPQMTELLNVCFELHLCLLLRLQQQRHIQKPRTHSFARQFPSPFKSLPQRGNSCRKDLTFPRIVPAVNDRFRKETRKWQKREKNNNHPFDARHDK